MADIEKAINDLEEIKGKLIPAIARMYGSGFSSVFACENMEEKINNAVELLKKKQPVKPIQFEKKSKVTRDKYECGACGSSEIYKEWDYCPYCGSPIDWKDGEQG